MSYLDSALPKYGEAFWEEKDKTVHGNFGTTSAATHSINRLLSPLCVFTTVNSLLSVFFFLQIIVTIYST